MVARNVASCPKLAHHRQSSALHAAWTFMLSSSSSSSGGTSCHVGGPCGSANRASSRRKLWAPCLQSPPWHWCCMLHRYLIVVLLLMQLSSRSAHGLHHGHARHQHWGHTDAYLLLGSPTSLCWSNAAQLEADFPSNQTHVHSTRPAPGQAAAPHLCSLPATHKLAAADAHSSLELLLQHAQALMPCGQGSLPACDQGTMHSVRMAFHAAAQSTLRFYIPPGAFSRTQLAHNLALNPLLCGQNIYDDASSGTVQQSTGQHLPMRLQHACGLLPGLLRLMGTIAAKGQAVDCRWDPTLPDLPGKVAHPLFHGSRLRGNYSDIAGWVQGVKDSVQGAGWLKGLLPHSWWRRHQRHTPTRNLQQQAVQHPQDQQAAEGTKHPHYLVAFALHNKQNIMPHFVQQVLALVTYLPPGHVLVSCYESGSGDDTPKWLHLLQGLLDLLHIPNHFVIQGNMTRGNQARIAFLASIRNMVLAPLYDPAVYAATLQRVHSQGSHQGLHQPSASDVFPADKIIYINDPFFSWQDLIRLVQHDVDIACGVDLIFRWEPPASPAPDSKPAARRRRLQQGAARAKQVGSDRWQSSFSLSGGAHAWLLTTGASRRLLGWFGAFYDFWVARDINGHQFGTIWPLVSDERGQSLMNQGLPAPVQCCWNAAVVLNAAPFRPGGVPAGAAGNNTQSGRLVFRAGSDDDCDASECTLMCNDFWKLGYSRVLVDPTVRLTYDPYPRQFLHEGIMHGSPMLSWRQMEAKLQQQQVDLQALLHHPEPVPAVTCCPILKGSDVANWPACHRDEQWLNKTKVGIAY